MSPQHRVRSHLLRFLPVFFGAYLLWAYLAPTREELAVLAGYVLIVASVIGLAIWIGRGLSGAAPSASVEAPVSSGSKDRAAFEDRSEQRTA